MSTEVKIVKSVDDFTRWVNGLAGLLMFYRGLPNYAWSVEASGYRRVKKEKGEEPSLSEFLKYIKDFLEKATHRGYRNQNNRSLSDLELLAQLQHNSAATCLIDFTRNPLIALWFACNDNQQDGKVVAVETGRTSGFERFSEIPTKKINDEIENFFYGVDNRLYKLTPEHQINRIVAQNSVFLFGKMQISDKDCYIVKIKKSNKKQILRELHHKYGITEEYLFSDFAGFSLANSHDKEYIDYSAEDYFDMAIESYQRNELEKTEKYLGKAIELKPDAAGAYYNRGNVRDQLGKYEDALSDYDEAIRLKSDYAAAYCSRGCVRETLKDYDKALLDFDEAIRLQSDYAVAYYNRGVVRLVLKEYDKALLDFDEAIRLKLDYAMAYYNRGIMRLALKEHDNALLDFNTVIRLMPNNEKAYSNRGCVKEALKDYQGALSDYDKAIELNSDYAVAYYNRSEAKKVLRNYEGAKADRKKYEELRKKD